MLGLLLGLFLLGLLAESGGRVVRRWTPNLLEQVAYGGALGLGILAYGGLDWSLSASRRWGRRRSCWRC